MSRISVVGTGYVGLTTGVCFAHLGHTVSCIDVDLAKVERLRTGETPIYEPGLEGYLKAGIAAGRLSFTIEYTEGLQGAEFVFIAVGTPMSDRGGAAEMQYVYEAAESIAHALTAPAVIVNKSTSPIGTGDGIRRVLEENNPALSPWIVVSNPEFLREGRAVDDCLKPSRVVLGSHEADHCDGVAALYERFDCPIIRTDLATAEMIKYASNAFLATKISFANELARLCDALGADVTEVVRGMALDDRIGSQFLNAGIGYGGSCFPKDVAALARMAHDSGDNALLLRAVAEVNASQQRWAVNRLKRRMGSFDGKTIAIWGVAFKPETDDVRFAPALAVAELLEADGATLRAYDPVARPPRFAAEMCSSPIEAATGADAVIICTEWAEFEGLDWKQVSRVMNGTLVLDGRNCVTPAKLAEAGLEYIGIGRAGGAGVANAYSYGRA